jgi:PPP family 3-phenylpropionic acid transporter
VIWTFWLLEFLIYLPGAFFSFIGNYYDLLGFSDLQIGILGSTAAFVILISSPFWLHISDRRIKNPILAILSFISALMVWTIYFSKSFWAIFIFAIVIGFFWTSIVPVAESISAYNSIQKGFSFGKARMMGSIGFAFMMFIFGYVTNNFIFFLLGSISFLIVGIMTFVIPKTRGYNEGIRMSFPIRSLPSQFYRMLFFELLVLSPEAFAFYFMPVFMRSRGYPILFAGMAMGIQALAEVPFLFFADSIIKRLGIKNVLVIASVTMGIRWILTFAIFNPVVIVAVQTFEFFNWIAIYYAIFYYINTKIGISRRADAQSLFWMTTSGFTAITGYIFGGWISNAIGVANGYLFFGIFTVVIGILYAAFEKSPDLR